MDNNETNEKKLEINEEVELPKDYINFLKMQKKIKWK